MSAAAWLVVGGGGQLFQCGSAGLGVRQAWAQKKEAPASKGDTKKGDTINDATSKGATSKGDSKKDPGAGSAAVGGQRREGGEGEPQKEPRPGNGPAMREDSSRDGAGAREAAPGRPPRIHRKIAVAEIEKGKTLRGKGKPLSLKRAVGCALKKNPDMKVLDHKRRAAQFRVQSAQGALLPRVKLEGSAFVWDSAVKFELGGLELGEPPDGCPLPIDCMTWFGDIMNSIDLGNVRDQFTAQLTVTVAQPITALFALLKKVDVEKLGVDLVKLERRSKKLELRYSVERAYLQVLMARRYLKIAREAVKLIKAHKKQVATYYAHEVVGVSEVLRVKLALRNATQRVTKVESAVELAEANLNRLMGAGKNSTYRYTETFPDPPKPLNSTLAELQKQALKNRPELGMVRNKRDQAKAGRKALRIMLLPEVNVVARYQFSEGMGAFTPQNTFFAGVTASWTWEWGNKYRKTQAMEAQVHEAQAALIKAERAIALQVRKHYLEVKTAEKNLKVSKTSLLEAKENLRIQRLKMGQQMKTVTDLLDAQTRYDSAKAQIATTLYSYYASLASLKQAVAQRPPKTTASKPQPSSKD